MVEKKFSRQDIQTFDGRNGRPAYIAYKGNVYDVTDNVFWANGNHLESHPAGVNLTSELENAPHGPEVFDGIVKVGILED